MTRLEDAVEVFLQWRQAPEGQSAQSLLEQNPDLRQHLEAMIDPCESGAPSDTARQMVGEFRLVREIGRGGMGVVYEAAQATLDRSVALKLLSAPLTLDASAIARFRREARTAARLEHPGIVNVHATGRDSDHHWFAMDFVDGAPLDSVLNALRQQPHETLSGADLWNAVSARRHRLSTEAPSALAMERPRAPRIGYSETVVELTAQVAEALDHAHRPARRYPPRREARQHPRL